VIFLEEDGVESIKASEREREGGGPQDCNSHRRFQEMELDGSALENAERNKD
jgi:hypothetical protein